MLSAIEEGGLTVVAILAIVAPFVVAGTVTEHHYAEGMFAREANSRGMFAGVMFALAEIVVTGVIYLWVRGP